MKQYYTALFKFYLLKILSTFGVRKEKERSILIVRDENLGDFLMFLPCSLELRKYADANGWKLVIVTRESITDFARSLSIFDEVIPSRSSSWKERFLLYRRCARLNVEIGINVSIFGKYILQDYLSLIPSPRKSFIMDTRKSLPHQPAFQKLSNDLFNDRYTERFPHDPNLFVIENEAGMISLVTGKVCNPTAGDLAMLTLPPPQVLQKPYYIVVPGSMDTKRQYPPEKFAKIIDGIQKEFPFLTPVISGMKREIPIAKKLLDHCASASQVIDLTGSSSLMEFFANIANASFIISNDTGAIHVAAKFRKKTFCFGGLWHNNTCIPAGTLYPAVTLFSGSCETPYCCGNCRKLKEGVFPCLGDYPEEKALETILSSLRKELGDIPSSLSR